MQQHDGVGPSASDFRDSRHDGAIRAKLGGALREKHDLMEPLAPRLLELLARLDTGIYVRETLEAKLYAGLDECVAAMVSVPIRNRANSGNGKERTPPATIQHWNQ